MTTPPTPASDAGSSTTAPGGAAKDLSTMPLPHAALEVLGSMVDNVVVMAGVQAAMDAYQAVLIDQARREAEVSVRVETSDGMNPWSQAKTAWRTIVSELACALRIPEVTAETLIYESKTLVNDLPTTLEGLRNGKFSRRHAQVIIDGSAQLPVESRAAFEATVLPYAETLTVSRLKVKARKVRERLDKKSMTERHAKAREDRHVEFVPDQDGMAWLNLFLDASVAQAAFRKATDIAKSLQGADESRTLAQLRADVLAEMMLAGEIPFGTGSGTDASAGIDTLDSTASARWADPSDPDDPPDDYEQLESGEAIDGANADSTEKTNASDTGSIECPDTSGDGNRRGNNAITGNPFAHIRPNVALMVPALSLLGRSDEPAILEGYGPIDLDTARRLVGNATSFTRILTHPETGTVLSVGRKKYRVPRAMRRWLAFRDQTCTKPGCGAPAVNCDLDHIVEWQHGGETGVQNLAFLCAKHHAEKHHTGWRTEMTPTGTRWTSPTGKIYDSPHGMDFLSG